MKMKNQLIALLLIAIGLIFFLSIISFNPLDLTKYHYPPLKEKANLLKTFGAHIGNFFIFYFGYTSLILPLILFIWSWLIFTENFTSLLIKMIGCFIATFSLSIFGSAVFSKWLYLSYKMGGTSGLYFTTILKNYFGIVGTALISLTIFFSGFIVATELPLFIYLVKLIKVIKFFFLQLILVIKRIKFIKIKKPSPSVIVEEKTPRIKVGKINKEKKQLPEDKEIKEIIPPKPKVTKEKEKPLRVRKSWGYQLPPLNLLNSPPPINERRIVQDLNRNAQLLEETLRDFGIEAKVVNIEKGPVITRYELQPAAGVKVQWITSLADDIALVMKSFNVNIIAPIPGKGTVGIDIPNVSTSYVYLKEVIGSAEFQKHPSLLALALGKTVSGEPLIADLENMPHLLIAGTTGSGKTVCINSIITSLLYKATPEEIKFILIDPKMVELAPFNGLPHLIVPVITDSNHAISSLEWAVEEMESRYRLLAKAGLRNITSYNEKKDKSPELPSRLSYIIIIIDELADLMLTASKEIESAIARLAQLSRAVGIHMVLATQRPSVDVITGVIKANFPSRISFKVASKVDSRTVLDMNGADKLLGKGDMLFIPPGTSKAIRAQGSLVSDEEIEKVVNFIKSQKEPQYKQEIFEKPGSKLSSQAKKDKIYQEAIDIVMQTGQASVSILQRRLGIGYTRAARLIDLMEEEGIVGPYRGAKPREILIDRESYLKNREIKLEKGAENENR